MANERFNRVIAAIDAYNQEDPNHHELGYSERLSAWVERRLPEASEALRIAAHGQHVGRWTIPRASYPLDRGGYLRWREALKRFHAATVTGFMAEAGYGTAELERVRNLILKKNLQSDPEAQALEDALCLLFLETQFDELRAKTEAGKMKEIVRKTWRKMSERGRAMALELPLSAGQKQLIQDALSSPT